MKPKTMILMVVAVVCGLAASYMTSRLLADKTPPPPAATVTVLVAKQKINAWTPIKNPEELFVAKEVPEGHLFAQEHHGLQGSEESGAEGAARPSRCPSPKTTC